MSRRWSMLYGTFSLLLVVLTLSEPVYPGQELVARAVQLSVGDRHACARLDDGSVQCWGKYHRNQTADALLVPIQVEGLHDVSDITSGNVHVCAVQDGRVYCWGHNGFGQLGNGSRDESPPDAAIDLQLLPTEVAGLEDVVDVEAGQLFTCALDLSGEVYCWGHNFDKQSDYRNRNPGEVRYALRPVRAQGIDSIMEIELGQRTACARKQDGTLTCWGFAAWWPENWESTISDRRYQRFAHANGQTNGICARSDETNLWCWGPDYYSVPTAFQQYTLPEDLTSEVFLYKKEICAVRGGSTVWCGIPKDFPYDLSACDDLPSATIDLCTSRTMEVPEALFVEFGGNFACALTLAGEVFCWGINSSGQLGDGTGADSDVPVRVDLAASGTFIFRSRFEEDVR